MTEELTVQELRERYPDALSPRSDDGYTRLVRVIGDFCIANHFDLPVKEHHFAAPQRDWRFDFCWPALKVACEYEGGTWSEGRHVRGAGYSEDCVKYSVAALMNWTVLRFTADLVEDGIALSLLSQALRLASARVALEGEQRCPPVTLDLPPTRARARRPATTGTTSTRPKRTSRSLPANARFYR